MPTIDRTLAATTVPAIELAAVRPRAGLPPAMRHGEVTGVSVVAGTVDGWR